jgi:hypothetical protein
MPAWAEGFGPDHLIRIDLRQRADFDRAATIGLKPVFRSGNEFYAVIDGKALSALTTAHLPFAVVETDPFSDGFYYVQSKSVAQKSRSLTKTADAILDEMAGWQLWKSDIPVPARGSLYGASLYPITDREVSLTYLTPLVAASPAMPSVPILDSIADLISEDSIVAYATYLENLVTRYTFTEPNDVAQAYIEDKFASFGYSDVDIDTFPVEGWYGHNVICTKPGTVEPDRCIIIGAHYDSYNGQTDPMILAPGCDDNASGTVGVLEIARALANMPTRQTIIFIAFDGEEQWMYGSYYYANRAAAAGMDIDVMINMDMIGYEPGGSWEVWLKTNPESIGYAYAAEQLALAYTNLLPMIDPYIGASDQLPFEEAGYHVLWAEEGEFNVPNYHMDSDRLSELNPPYWTDVVRTVGLLTYNIAESPRPVEAVELWDVGDGQTLEARWTPVTAPDVTGYRVYYGTYSGAQSHMVAVSGAGAVSQQIGGLNEGTLYYVSVAAVLASGGESIVRPEASLIPYYLPRTPSSVAAETEYHRVDLSWDPSVELDFDHYVIYRGLDSLSLTEYESSVAASSYNDGNVDPATLYFYRVVAVDGDGNQSPPSDIVWATSATFDQGILLFNLTAHFMGNPTEEQQLDVYSAIFAAYPHGYCDYDDYDDPVAKSELGQYGTLYWIDDDLSWENWPADHWAKLNWYLSYGNSFVVVGWQTPNEASSGSFLYDQFRISDIECINAVDCVGGIGEGGFPSVVFDTAKVVDIYTPWDGKLAQIWTMTPADASAEVILRYNSAIDDPAREMLAVGIRRNTGIGRIALLSLPLYYIRNADAQAVVATLSDWFGIPAADPGDLNADGSIDLLDVMVACDVIFEGMSPPTGYLHTDTNGDCMCNVLDVVCMIDYVFRGGPEPVAGCAR